MAYYELVQNNGKDQQLWQMLSLGSSGVMITVGFSFTVCPSIEVFPPRHDQCYRRPHQKTKTCRTERTFDLHAAPNQGSNQAGA
jgi:hypothetical protein